MDRSPELSDGVLAEIVERAHDAIISVDDAGRILLFNLGAMRIFGYTPTEVLGRPIDVLIPGRYRGAHRSALATFSAGASSHRSMSERGPIIGLRKNGTEFDAAASIDRIDTAYGPVLTVVLSDITAQRQIESALRSSQHSLQTAQRLAQMGSWEWEVGSSTVEFSAELSTILGLDHSPTRHPGTLLELAHLDDHHALQQALTGASRGQGFDVRHRIVRPDGSIRFVRHRAEPIVAEDSRQARLQGIVIDVTQRQLEIERTLAHERLLSAVLDAMSAHTAVIDDEGVIIAANRVWLETFEHLSVGIGIGGCYLDPSNWCSVVQPATLMTMFDGITSVAKGRTERFEIDALATIGPGSRWFTVTAERLDATTGGAVITHNDITARKVAESALAYEAMHDRLTGLPNRLALTARLAELIDDHDRRDRAAMLFLDLDRFKLVNDSLGHSVGDELLIAVGRRLVAAVRDGDLVTRFGGDEFVIVCEDLIDQSSMSSIGQRVLSAFDRAVDVGGHLLFVTPSIGVAYLAGTETPDEVLRHADAAMYQAKADPGVPIAVYDADLRRRAHERMELESELREAIDAGAICLHYQPFVDLETCRPIGAEALARWSHPTLGPISPGVFIPLAEETGLIHRLGVSIVEEACRQLARWSDIRSGPFRPPGKVSVNLSAKQLSDPTFIDALAAAIGRYGADPTRLCIEITETAVMDDPNAARKAFEQIHGLGVAIAIDDFGTGHGSLTYLSDFPVDIIKIDQQFVARLGVEHRTNTIVRHLTSLAVALGIEVIAEGIETPTQAAILRSVGCAVGQGFLFSRAVPPDQLSDRWADLGALAADA